VTSKPHLPLDPEDLSIRVRRGDSTAEERRALEHALQASALLRTAHRAGRDFDEASRVRPGDEELVARAASRALATRARSRGRRSAVLLGVAAALVAAAGAAALGAWHSPETAGGELSPRSDRRPPTPTPAVRAAPPAPDEAARTAPVEVSEALPAEPRRHTASQARAEEPAEVASNASSLFREANAARRAAEVDRAQNLYLELQMKFPDSNEAMVSYVSLGKVLLGASRVREAERQFRTYLTRGGKSLEEEALVGRADALARLGESGEERRVWQDLLSRHPSGVYAARARQRLGELEAAETPR
jgi:TolA-binding protein